jgi:predicted porin
MKKHIIAAAVAAIVSAPAIAQNVTFSGVVDVTGHSRAETTLGVGAGATTVTKAKGNGSSAAGDGYSTSQIVLTATDDLGGGLRATALMSARISQANATAHANGSTIGGRDRWIQLEGGFGGIRIGRYAGAIDDHGAYSGAGTTNTAGHVNTLVDGTAGRFYGGLAGAVAAAGGDMSRNDGSFQYSSPTVNGVQAIVGFTNNGTDIDTTANEVANKMSWGSLRFTNGPLTLQGAMAKRKINAEAVAIGAVEIAGSGKGEMAWVGGTFDLGPAVLLASYATKEDSTTTAAGVTAVTTDLNLSTVGVRVPFGPYTLRASFYRGADDRAANNNADNVDLEGNQLSLTYALSKRTMLYVATGKNEIKLTTTQALSGAAYQKVSSTNAGISHTF